MKTVLFLITITAFSCVDNFTPKDKKLIVSEPQEKADTIFRQITDFPILKDSAKFITDLRQIFDLEVEKSTYQEKNEKITAFKKVKIYGSEKDYYFIEYDYGYGAGSTYPWKYQMLLTRNGKPLKVFAGQRFDFVEIFKNENPFLLIVKVTSKGNGGHELFKISADSVENVYEGYFDYSIRTYDAHQDNRIYEPNELTLKVKDFNSDGFNDIAFNGEIILIKGQTKMGDWFDSEVINDKIVNYSVDNPFKKISVEFVFIYDNESGHFKAMEDYAKIYELYN